MKYEKTNDDLKRENNDLQNNPIMRWMRHHENFRFNVGDVLIKQSRGWQPHGEEVKWDTELTSKTTMSPRKYIYAFENELGIGYLRQLRCDGSGYTDTLICMANFDPERIRFILDPDYADHLMIGDGDFKYNQEYEEKKKFREEAIVKNRPLLVRTGSIKKTIQWFDNLKPGDEFWFGKTFDELVESKYEVEEVLVCNYSKCPSHVAAKLHLGPGSTYNQIKLKTLEIGSRSYYNRVGHTQIVTADHFLWNKVSMTKPFPLKDDLCGQRR